MEFCNRGNLENYVIEAKRSDQLLLSFIKQMADAIQYSHSRRIVHRDLKPENVLITMNNGQLIAKIADFGLAKMKLTSTVSLPSRGLPLASYIHTEAGTKLYMAPEVYNGNYTEKADVFSLGIMFCAILERTILDIPRHGKRLVIFFSGQCQEPVGMFLHTNPGATRTLDPKVNIPEESRNLINSMIRASYKSRPSAEEVHESLQSASGSYCCIL
ncbi:serine/threonine-protein kinase pdik1l-A-like [Ptychodera flava]|uniref:serine/threonine-protein kinase pdik1l-A-like n=1 Tax=Ptychodera flava TaxID=63121 RepID=UPI003969CE1E